MSTPALQEKFEELERVTNESISEIVKAQSSSAVSMLSQLLNWLKEIIKTQNRELCLLREIEAAMREVDSAGTTDPEAHEHFQRIDNLLSQLDLFRQAIAEKNATQAPAAS